MASRKISICAILVIYVHVTYGQTARARCDVTSVAGDEFQFRLRLDRGMDASITSIAFYNSSEAVDTSTPVINSPAQCTDTTLDSFGEFEVGFSVDGDADPLPCGISRSGNEYRILVAVVGNTKSAVDFTCITGTGGNINNFPTIVNITTFETGNIDRLAHVENGLNIRLQIVLAGGNSVPALFGELGERVKARVILDKDAGSIISSPTGEIKYNNFGRSFHIPFLKHDGASESLQIVTAGLGTWVQTIGNLDGDTFSDFYPIKRDWARTVTDFPDSYRQLNTSTQWNTTASAIKVIVPVRVPGEFVAIKVLSQTSANAGSFMALPDDVLGKQYNCYTGSTGQDDGICLVYAIQDTTDVNITFNGLSTSGIFINGEAGTATSSVMMNENDVLNIQCGASCDQLQITANKPVGVVTGHENAKISDADLRSDFFVSQMPPVETYGDTFVLIDGFLLGYTVRYQIILDDPQSTVNYTSPSGTTSGVTSGTYITPVTNADEVTFSKKVLLLMVRSNFSPVTMPFPAVHQWATSHYLYQTTNEFYSVVLVARTGEVRNIQFLDYVEASSFGRSALVGDLGVTIVPVTGSSTYEYGTLFFNGRRSGLVEFKSGTLHRPFMLIVRPRITGRNEIMFMSIGTRYYPFHPCTNSSTRTTSFGNIIKSVPGDFIDNDCDGTIDGEVNDNKDTDGDGLVDEDLAPREPRQDFGIFVDKLIVSNNAQFSSTGTGSTYTLLENGCSKFSSGPFGDVKPFEWLTTLGPMFDHLFVQDTPSFKLFSLGQSTLYFRAYVGTCIGDLSDSRCNMSCAASMGRKRRQVEEQLTMVETRVDLTSTNTGSDIDIVLSEPETIQTCTMNKLYWIPAVIVLVTILTETITIGTLLCYRSSAINKF